MRRDLSDVRRTDLLLAFGDEDEVDGDAAPGAADRVERGEEGRLRALLVHRAATHHDLSEAVLIDDPRLERRRRPLGGIGLLDVIHEVQRERLGRPGVEGREHRGMAIRVDALRHLEPRLARQLHHQRAALVHAAVLGSDRGMPDPVLKTADALVAPPLDLVTDAREIAGEQCVAQTSDRHLQLLPIARRSDEADRWTLTRSDHRVRPISLSQDRPASAALVSRMKRPCRDTRTARAGSLCDDRRVASRVAWLHVAPIKSLGVQVRERVTLRARGVEEDRRFCIVDEKGHMLNAKRVAAFVTVRPELDDAMAELALHFPDGASVRGPIELGAPVTVSIYRRAVSAHEVRGPFTRALSRLGGRTARLVRFDEAGEGVDRSADGGAATLLSLASLDALARAAGVDGPVDPRRFRMLIGVAGVPAHAEDGWLGREVRVGSAVVVPLGNVGRCVVTTLDPERAVSDLDTLAALAAYRGAQPATESLPFGVWARVEQPGTVAVGDPVVV